MIRPHIAAILAAAFVLPAFGQGSDPISGRNLASNCANCHGTNGQSAGGIPSLAGQRRDDLVRVMGEFREGKRPATIMHQLSKGYTPQQVELIADYFSAQKAR